jgi:hypothetical protein
MHPNNSSTRVKRAASVSSASSGVSLADTHLNLANRLESAAQSHHILNDSTTVALDKIHKDLFFSYKQIINEQYNLLVQY